MVGNPVALGVLVITAAVSVSLATSDSCFQKEYSLDLNAFITDGAVAFKDVTDIAFNHHMRHVIVLQRSFPPVTIWDMASGELLLKWDTKDLGYPHSLTLDTTPSSEPTLWITDMAGRLAAGRKYGHCIKQFTYNGKFIRSIGKCGSDTNGSDLNPVQFDRVTDLALDSRGYMYVTDGDIGGANNRVLVFNPDSKLIDVWNKENKPGSNPLQFDLPHSVHIDWCDRVWITDTNNHRVQVINNNGTFLNEWSCFNDSLIYGIDIAHETDSSFVVLTAKNRQGESEILILHLEVNDCSKLASFGSCTVQRRLVKKDVSTKGAMLHSVAFDSMTGDFYASLLPGTSPPLKYVPVSLPPKNDLSVCPAEAIRPKPWAPVWRAAVLLTPYSRDDIHTAQVVYSSNLQAMHVTVYGPDDVREYLNIGNKTFVINRNLTVSTCSEEQGYKWRTPTRDWLSPRRCECKGALNVSGIDTVAWTCLVDNQREWYWVHRGNASIWRVFLNSPNSFPVIGEYAMSHFSYETYSDLMLKEVVAFCTQKPHQSRRLIPNRAHPVKGFSYTGCPPLPAWPDTFHSTVTMVPVSLDDATPMPTQVVYDWEEQTQRTTMCTATNTYNAYMTRNNTYLINQKLATGEFECLSHLDFGPPKPKWMALDGCECKGTIHDNFSLTPFKSTVIAVCPVTKDRVFWTWFTAEGGFSPLLFFETLTPAAEGTGLALADYHTIHKGSILLDLKELEVPCKC